MLKKVIRNFRHKDKILFKRLYRLVIIKIDILLLVFPCITAAQQQPDTLFQVNITSPHYDGNSSPIISIDGLHNNLHQVDTNFSPFAKLAQKDGYTVNGLTSFSNLEGVDVLVIANAINEKNMGNWQRPIYPAFAKDEIEKIVDYVQKGGSLLLIADHMPFAGAASNLASAFGFDFCDGFAQLAEKEKNQDVFSTENKRLLKSILTDGSWGNKIDKIISFTGSSFTIPKKAHGILQFQKDDICLIPEVAWQFDEYTERLGIDGNYQGAIMKYGKGKIAVFSEAAMFTAQSITQNGYTFKVGFNSGFDHQNVEFIRNLLYWLSKDSDNGPGTSTVKEEILKVNRNMEKEFNAGNYAEVAGFYTEDSKMIGPKTNVEGREMREYWGKFQGNMVWDLENIVIKNLNENYAMQLGISKINYVKNNGTPAISASKFTVIWKKTDKGWKILHDFFFPIHMESISEN